MSAITICSKKPYKTPGFHFNSTSFRANTYSFDEVFHPSIYANMKEKVSIKNRK